MTPGSLLRRCAFMLGVATRRAVEVVSYPVRAAARLYGSRTRRVETRLARLLPPARRPAADPGEMVDRGRLRPAELLLRHRAVLTAGELDPEQATPRLLQLLNDSEAAVRAAAADALGQARSEPAVFSLILAIDDPSDEVRGAAARALGRITGRTVTPRAETRLRQEQIEELKSWWKEQRLARLAGGLVRERS